MVANLLWLACASSRTVELEGSSEVIVTATSKVKFKATGPMTFPSSYPAVGGMHLAAGETVSVDLKPGESVTLRDRIRFDGETIIIGMADTTTTENVPNSHRLVTAPSPTSLVDLTGTIQSDSTYTWTVPYFFGNNEAVVKVSGSISAQIAASGVIDNGNGTFNIDTSQLKAFDYQVSGPPAIWQAPLNTPYGTIKGSGTIETDGNMVFGFTGDLSAVSAGGVTGFVDDDGQVFEYGYDSAFPVRLSITDGVAVGVTTVWGGINTF